MDTYKAKIVQQREIYATFRELANTKCDISCWECPFVIRPHGTRCMKRMIQDLLNMHDMCRNPPPKTPTELERRPDTVI